MVAETFGLSPVSKEMRAIKANSIVFNLVSDYAFEREKSRLKFSHSLVGDVLLGLGINSSQVEAIIEGHRKFWDEIEGTGEATAKEGQENLESLNLIADLYGDQLKGVPKNKETNADVTSESVVSNIREGMKYPRIESFRCNGCRLCLTFCKNRAIIPGSKKSKSFVINLTRCDNCGECLEKPCPTKAIVRDQ